MAALSAQDLRALDHTRQRLSQLTNSLASLQQQILASDPLPPWPSLHSLSQIISQSLSSVSSHLTTHALLLSSLAAYPLPTYPGREQEPVLNQLLRKKLEPLVDEWVEEGRAAGERVGTGDWGIGEEEVVGVWEWAGAAANALARGHAWGGEFTIEEGEGEGGIESEDDEGAAGDDDMDVEGGVQDGGERAVPPPPPLPMADLQRFMVKGKEEPGR